MSLDFSNEEGHVDLGEVKGPHTGRFQCPMCGHRVEFKGAIPKWRLRWHDVAGCLLRRMAPRKVDLSVDWVGISLLLAMAVSLVGLATRGLW